MAFGRPPICILRIGDFYYTKVVIDSVNISYDDSLFDLNPEGIGNTTNDCYCRFKYESDRRIKLN